MPPLLSLLFIILISNILSDGCVTHDFEEDLNRFKKGEFCSVHSKPWNYEYYSTIGVESPHWNSTAYITPNASGSCISSYIFEMEVGGVIEVTTYMESRFISDQIQVVVSKTHPSSGGFMGSVVLSSASSKYMRGWHTSVIQLASDDGTKLFTGYINFLGMASPDSIILIDSFRYVPPLYNKKCTIYDEDIQKREDCVTYDFEKDFDVCFTAAGHCHNSPIWQLGDYTSRHIEALHKESHSYISPRDSMSCSSSFTFPMSTGGLIAAYVYANISAPTDSLSAMVYETSSHKIVGSLLFRNPIDTHDVNGWYLYHGILGVLEGRPRNFLGYVSFIGRASSDSDILVDSFRYVPSWMDAQKECSIYDNSDIETTTREPEGEESCVTYDFEQDYDTLFNNSGTCINSDSWNLGHYTSLFMDGPFPNSNLFISPTENLSCVSSFSFHMRKGGFIEVNVFASSLEAVNRISIFANQIVPNGVDAFVGFITTITPMNPNYVDGWYTFSGLLETDGYYEGYIIFMGIALSGTIVLVDSFRYISPNLEETECLIYENEDDITTIPPPDTCITYNFEEGISDEFVNDGVCENYQPWDLGHFSSIIINNPNPHSSFFITPRVIASCISTFTFTATASGIVEVHVYMAQTAPSDYISVTVKDSNEDGDKEIIGALFYTSSDADFKYGWRNLTIYLGGTGSYDCYITFKGSASKKSVVLIDAFRYIPPLYDEEQCPIYDFDDGGTTEAETPDVTTTTTKNPITDKPPQPTTYTPTETTIDNISSTNAVDSTVYSSTTNNPDANTTTEFTTYSTTTLNPDEYTTVDSTTFSTTTDSISTPYSPTTSTTDIYTTTNSTTYSTTTDSASTPYSTTTVDPDEYTTDSISTAYPTTTTINPDEYTTIDTTIISITTDSISTADSTTSFDPESTPTKTTTYSTTTVSISTTYPTTTTNPNEYSTTDSTTDATTYNSDESSSTHSTQHTVTIDSTEPTTSRKPVTFEPTESTTISTIMPDIETSTITAVTDDTTDPITPEISEEDASDEEDHINKPITDRDGITKLTLWLQIMIILIAALILIITCLGYTFCCYRLGSSERRSSLTPIVLHNNNGHRTEKQFQNVQSQRDINATRQETTCDC